MIVYPTDMPKFPPNCMECVMTQCHLPMRCNSHGGITDTMKKAYTQKRHKDCPLTEVVELSAKNREV